MRVYVDANPKEYAMVTEEGTTIVGACPEGCTNNEAEYRAIIAALKEFPDVTEIISDSQLVVRQLNHEYSIKEDRLRTLAMQVWKLVQPSSTVVNLRVVSSKHKVKFTWIPRKQNLAGRVLG